MLKHWKPLWQPPVHLAAILNSYSEVFFIRGKLSGIFLLTLGFWNHHAALAGLFSVICAYLFAHLVGFQKEYLQSGYYTYNPLLVGLATGYLFQFNLLTLTFTAIVSVFTFIVTVFLANIFYRYLGLQILSIPFVIVSSLIYLASSRFSNLYVSGSYSHFHDEPWLWMPEVAQAFFRSLGAIVFMPHVLPGALIACLILLKSRILFFLASLGFLEGIFLSALLTGALQPTLHHVSGFNYILVAMALGGVFNIPSLRSYAIAGLGVAISSILINSADVFWAQYGIPVFTLPFTVVTLSMTYTLSLANHQTQTRVFKSTPEENLDYHLTTQTRFPQEGIILDLPFSGSWVVWQGFDGEWTHQGIWKHAYDFVIQDGKGTTYAHEGKRLSDYYCYQQPVLSPVRGRVIRVISHFPDNPIGSVDRVNNWGNLVIIQDELGRFVELSHFSKDQIFVAEGAWVERGTSLGLCGNSGYSPQPHIHLQVQSTAVPGSETLPFTFRHFLANGEYHTYGTPSEGTRMEHLAIQPFYDQVSTFILDQTLCFDVYKSNTFQKSIELQVRMEVDGTFYFARGESKLYFGKQDGSFFCYHLEGKDPYLKKLFLCFPSMPMIGRLQLKWRDILPTTIILGPIQSALVLLANAFYWKPIQIHGQYQFLSENVIQGHLYNKALGIQFQTSLTLNPQTQIQEFSVGASTFKQKLASL